jgi:hypothetical protein
MAISSKNLELLSKDKSIGALKLLLEHFDEQYNLSSEELIAAISDKTEKEAIPLTAFADNKLSSLEIIVKYLKEETGKTYHQIAQVLKRDDRTIWATYNNSTKKSRAKLKIAPSSVFVPLHIFSVRHLSVLETLVIFLKETHNYSFSKIAELLSKDYQTIYTTYRRGKSRK